MGLLWHSCFLIKVTGALIQERLTAFFVEFLIELLRGGIVRYTYHA